MSKILEQRMKILKGFEEDLKDELIPALLVEPEAGDETFPLLNILLEDFILEGQTGRGEFFFLPSEEGDEIQIFTNIITVTENISNANIDELCKAVAGINLFVETGGFAIDYIEGRLIYKHGYEMTMPLDDAALKDMVDLTVGSSLQVAEEYGRYLLEVNEGTRDAMDVVKTLAEARQ